jgi:hypothetical protein
MRIIKYKFGDQRGVVFILVIIAIGALLAFTALALDVGNVMVVKNELHNVSDAAALAATRKLGNIYEGMSYEDQLIYNATAAAATIKSVANEVATLNKASGAGMEIIPDDVKIGRWNSKTKEFTENLMQPDAVMVTARKDERANGPVATFFARIFIKDPVKVSTTATAALTGQSTAGPGGLPIPVGISRAWFESKQQFCGQPIRFYPTGTAAGCAGWHTYEESPPSASRLKSILDSLKNRTYQSPATTAGTTIFNFNGGTLTSAFSNMQSLFNTMKVLNDGVLDADNDSTTWTTSVVVYDRSDCSNPNTAIRIAGFATVVIRQVLDSPDKIIDGDVVCDSVETGRGSGENFGTKGSIPGLVK